MNLVSLLRRLCRPLLTVAMVSVANADPRLAILTDIGNEPDDQMSLVRLLVYSNEIEVEAIVASTSVWQRDTIRPDIAHSVIDAYAKVEQNLRLHADGWPSAQTLRDRVVDGVSGYGMAAINPDKPSAGATRLIELAQDTAAGPLWVGGWGGVNTLAEALQHARKTLSEEQLAALVANMRVYTISDQDDAGAWVRREFPGLFYIASPSSQDGEEYARATWTGIAGDRFYRNGAGADFSTVSNEWLETNIRSKGPLGKHYPEYLFIMEGDTPSFLGLISNGLNAPEHPNWGGWGGRYLLRTPGGETRPIWTQGGDSFPRITSADSVNGVVSDHATIWRWREAFQHDFAARMSWSVEPFANANHPPVVRVNGSGGDEPLRIPVTTRQAVSLDAGASSDPDSNGLTYRWIAYPEAGYMASTPPGVLSLSATTGDKTEVTVSARCAPMWFDWLECPPQNSAHLVLAVTDDGSPTLTRYRRVIFEINDPVTSQDDAKDNNGH